MAVTSSNAWEAIIGGIQRLSMFAGWRGRWRPHALLLNSSTVFCFTRRTPIEDRSAHPISGREIDFSTTPLAQNSDWLLDGLEQSPNFAVRRGDLIFRGWRIGESAQRAFEADPTKNLEESDLVPHLVQKGVDMRIGLDIAAMALKRLVNTIVILTGDADMVPAMRLARREGLRVGLCSLGFRGVRSELRAHADFEVKWSP